VAGLIIGVINTSFVGHLGDENQVAGVGMASMLINILCLSVLMGMSLALNTFVSQAFGLKEYQLCGVHHNRARILVSAMFLMLIIPL